ncbi:ABC transporter ATP-binding protein [Helicovermis profundi]|uniref:ABC transporter domain-containing protein n=1 Tax=Helicovermis profundi TaxID=3065157 RepID=A0AAU9E313_9FIRM|nr:hypothetical protein HLPR_12170 [Clostridia bacterium S502]
MEIKVENLNFKYNDNDVLSKINLKFNSGKIYGILGRNGSGKTTLIKLILGLLKQNSGNIYIGKENSTTINFKKLSKLIAFVPQDYESQTDISVIDIVLMGRNPYLNTFQNPSKEDYKICYRVMENLNLTHLSNYSFSKLSGGQRQMVLVARAIAQETEFIVFDEPISNLDIKNQHDVLAFIKNMANRYGKGIIVSIHDPNLANRYCDNIVMLKDGQVFKNGLSKDVFSENTLKELYDIDFNFIENDIISHYKIN